MFIRVVKYAIVVKNFVQILIWSNYMSIKCPRCGISNGDLAIHCAACGKELNIQTTKIQPVNPIKEFFGFAELDGKVVNVNPIYFQPPDFNWNKVLLSFIIILFLLNSLQSMISLLIVFIGIILIFWLSFRMLIPIDMSNMFLSFFQLLFRRNPKTDIPVQDIIVQDSKGKHLVRIKGHLSIGSVSIGDSISINGKIRNGMFIFRSGYNNSINSALKLRGKIF